MKKLCISFFLLFIIFSFVSCADDEKSETTADNAVTDEISTEFSSEQYYPEDYSSPLIYPDFSYPQTINVLESYMSLPDYDDTEKTDSSEKFISNGTVVYEKTYNNDKLTSVNIYESDGVTVSELYEYIYNDDGTTAVDIDYYKDGATILRRKFTFFSNGSIKSIYNMSSNSETGAPIVDSFEFNEKGELVYSTDSDSFSQIMVDAILNGLSNG